MACVSFSQDAMGASQDAPGGRCDCVASSLDLQCSDTKSNHATMHQGYQLSVAIISHAMIRCADHPDEKREEEAYYTILTALYGHN